MADLELCVCKVTAEHVIVASWYSEGEVSARGDGRSTCATAVPLARQNVLLPALSRHGPRLLYERWRASVAIRQCFPVAHLQQVVN